MLVGEVDTYHRGPVAPVPDQLADQGQVSPDMMTWLATAKTADKVENRILPPSKKPLHQPCPAGVD